MFVHAMLFEGPTLLALEGIAKHAPHVFDARLAGLSFDVAVSSELRIAGLALGDGVVGVVVGQLQNGTPALLALERDLECVCGHGAALH